MKEKSTEEMMTEILFKTHTIAKQTQKELKQFNRIDWENLQREIKDQNQDIKYQKEQYEKTIKSYEIAMHNFKIYKTNYKYWCMSVSLLVMMGFFLTLTRPGLEFLNWINAILLVFSIISF